MSVTQLKLLVVSLLFSLSFYAQNGIEKIDFLIGTWKMEGKNTYEHWSKEGNVLRGESFNVKDAIKYVTETLKIEQIDGTLVYTASVMNQNDGKGIPFKLNTEIGDKLSFENMTHDFPKKICYTQLTDTEIFVEVLGDNDEGFSFKMVKE